MKKIITASLIVLCLGVIAYVCYTFSRQQKHYADSFSAIPASSSLILEINRFDEFAAYFSWMKQLSANSSADQGNPMAQWPEALEQITALYNSNAQWIETMAESKIIFASSSTSRPDGWLLSIGLPDNDTHRIAKELMSSWKGETFTERKFENEVIYEIPNSKWTWTVLNGCLVMAAAPSFIEEVLLQEESTFLIRNNAFAGIRSVTSKDEAFHFFSHWEGNDWLELDPQTNEHGFQLSGFAILADSSKSNLRISGSGGYSQIATVLPSNVELLDVFTYPDFETGWKTTEDFFTGTNAPAFWSQAWTDFGDSCQCDLNDALLNWRDAEWGSAVLGISDSISQAVSFIRVRDSINVLSVLAPLLAENTNGIYRVKFPQVFARGMSSHFLVENNYAMAKGGFLILGASMESLKSIQSTTSTLAADEKFAMFNNAVGEASGHIFYQRKYYTSLLPEPMMKALANADYVGTTVERIEDNRMLFNVLFPSDIKAAEATPSMPMQEMQTVDTTATPAPSAPTASGNIIGGPWTVSNHATGEKEKVLQYSSNEIALIAANGEELWRKDVKAPVLGDVTQIDALNNGKLQMVFSTQNGIHILDRKGNELPGFPILPKPPVTSGVLVADYDKTKKYRLLVAMGDGSVSNLKTDGQTMEGWRYQKGATVKGLGYAKLDGDDIIITADESGNVQVHKRNGDVRPEKCASLSNYKGGMLRVTSNSLKQAQLEFTDASGAKRSQKLLK